MKAGWALVVAAVGLLSAVSPVLALPVWVERHSAEHPAATAGAAMAYDPQTHQTILFGGYQAVGRPFHVTWNWDGNAWIRLHPANHPPGWFYASMAYDKAQAQLIMFGSTDAANSVAETWEWTGTNWVRLHPATSPTARVNQSMAYDSHTGQLILFGGSPGIGARADTWSWNGNTWTRLHPKHSPPKRQGAAFAYDGTEQRLILFGGGEPGDVGDALRDTWAWTGADWIQLHPVHRPNRRTDASMAWDAGDRQLVLFGGDGRDAPPSTTTYGYPGTWTWTNGDWVSTGQHGPKGRYAAALAYVPNNKGLLVFGGARSSSPGVPWAFTGLLGDTWLYSGHPPA